LVHAACVADEQLTEFLDERLMTRSIPIGQRLPMLVKSA